MNNLLAILTPIFFEASCFSFVLLSIALLKRSYHILVASLICFSIIFFDYIFLLLPGIIDLPHLHWNFIGKLGEVFWSLVVIYLLRWVSPLETGLNKPKYKHLLLAMAIGFIYTLFSLSEWTLTHQLPPKNILNFETVLFQLTLPGLAEELFSRGVLLGILNRYFVGRWYFLNVKWGVAAVLVTIFFILGHLFTFNQGEHLITFHIDYLSFDLIFLSLCLIYLREKTGSIWPGVIFHNLANGLPILITWVFLST